MTWRQKEISFKLYLNGIPFDIQEPEGFTELESVLERDRQAHGTFFEYTPAEFPLRFTGLAKNLLKAQFDNFGVDAQANLAFESSITTIPPFVQLFGQVDFSQAKDNQDYFSCSILRSDLLIKLQNNIDKKVDLLSGVDIYGNWSYPINTYTARFQPFIIKKQFRASQIIEDDFNLIINNVDVAMVLFQFSEEDIREMDETINRKYEIRTYDINSEFATWLVIDEPGDYDITFNYHFNYSHRIHNVSGPNTDYTHNIIVKAALFTQGYFIEGSETDVPLLNDNSNFVELVSILSSISSGGPGLDTTLTGTAQGSLNSVKTLDVSGRQLQQGDWILVWVEFDTGNYQAGIETTYKYQDLGSQIDIVANTRYSQTDNKCLLIGDAIEQNIRMITGQPIPLDSDFFASDGCGYNNILLNGYQLRGIDKPILASFRDLFHKGVQPIFGLGYSIENARVKVELWEYFYQETELINLGEVGDYEEEVLGDDIFNQCTFGFRTYANDDNLASTLDDFHTEGSWNTPIENVSGEFSMISDFILSSFLIEQSRRLALTEKPTVSGRYDDRLFMVAIKDDYIGPDYDFAPELASDFLQVYTGMDNIDTAFNLRHTIKRMLLNWGVWINSFAFRDETDDSDLINLYFLNNGSLTTQFKDTETCTGGDDDKDLIIENADVNKLEIQNGEAKFDQALIRFIKQLSQEQVDLIRDAHDGDLGIYEGRYGYITVTDYKGIEQTGWLLKMQFNLYSNLAKFELLKRHIRTSSTEIFDGFCVAESGYFSVDSTINTIIAGYVSLAIGKLKSIKFSVSGLSGAGQCIFDVRRAGGEKSGSYPAWQGDPDSDTSIYRIFNGIIDIYNGENTITLNKDIPFSDMYAVRFEYYGHGFNVSRFTLSDPPQSCIGFMPGPSQVYQFGAWTNTAQTYPLRMRVEYDYSQIDLRTQFITSSAYNYFNMNHVDDKVGQQMYFISDSTVKILLCYTLHSGSPTGTVKAHLATRAAGFPDTDIATVDFTPANGATNILIFDDLVNAGDFIVYFTYNSDGTIDGSNYYRFRYATTGYIFGNLISDNDGTGWVEASFGEESIKLMIKIKYEPS